MFACQSQISLEKRSALDLATTTKRTSHPSSYLVVPEPGYQDMERCCRCHSSHYPGTHGSQFIIGRDCSGHSNFRVTHNHALREMFSYRQSLRQISEVPR